jgi:predicted DNA repair protein MutK
MYLLEKPESGRFAGVQHGLGRIILKLAPKFMRTLAIVGTAAMFLVGGGILVHAIPVLSHWLHAAEAAGASISLAPGFFEILAGVAFNGLVGVAVGAVLVLVFGLVSKVLPHKTEQPGH